MDDDELQYAAGSRAAWLLMLRECLRQLGVDDPEAGKVRWVTERVETLGKLREVCSEHGDNDWEDDLHLADVVEKHLRRHLDRGDA